jgi:hypothetical protein
MTKKDMLLKEIEHVPEPLYEEVLDFIQFLKSRKLKETLGMAIMSESSLKKDWLKPEEDEAWNCL